MKDNLLETQNPWWRDPSCGDAHRYDLRQETLYEVKLQPETSWKAINHEVKIISPIDFAVPDFVPTP